MTGTSAMPSGWIKGWPNTFTLMVQRLSEFTIYVNDQYLNTIATIPCPKPAKSALPSVFTAPNQTSTVEFDNLVVAALNYPVEGCLGSEKSS